MYQRYLDEMAVMRRHVKPDLFITITMNPECREMQEASEGNAKEDRVDLLARIFKAKLDEFLRDIKLRGIFGRVVADCWVVEFQKRGLPHAHLLIVLHKDSKILTSDHIDSIIGLNMKQGHKRNPPKNTF